MRPPPIKFWGNLLLLLVSSAIAFLLVEAGARLYLFGSLASPGLSHDKLLNVPHPERGWQLLPDETVLSRTLDYVVSTHTNHRGLNDDDTPYEKPPGVFRIVVLGDSFMFGKEIERTQGLPALLETQLKERRVEVINLGVIGYGTIQEYLLLREEGLKYKPDLVLLGFYAFNDIRDNSKALNELMWGPQVILTWGRPYAGGDNAKGALKFEFPDIHRLRRANFERRERFTKEYEMAPTYSRLATSMLTRYVLRQWLKKMQPLEFDPAVLFGPYLEGDAIPHAAEWKQAWDTTERVLLATRDTAREAGAKFAIFTIPSRFQVDAHYREMVADQVAGLKFDLQKPEKQLVDFGQQEGIPVLDLTPVFSEVQEKQGTPLHHQLEDEHWNPNGHALAATAVRKFLEEQRLLP